MELAVNCMHMLSIVSLIGFLVCFVPIVMNFGEIDKGVYLSFVNTLESDVFRYSLVASIAVATPMGLDFMIDIFIFIWNNKNSLCKGNIRLPRPDSKLLLILYLMIPNLNADLLNSFLGARVILILYGFSIQIWIYGESHLKNSWFVLGYFFMILCVTLMTLDSYTVFKAPDDMILIEVAFFSIGALCLTVIFIRWISILRSIGYYNITQSQKDNLLYVIIFGIFGICLTFVTVCFLIAIGKFNANYYIIITYLESMISICFIIFETRASKAEVLSMKDVSDMNF